MYYVYLLRSINHQDQTYIGYTTNLKDRLKKHNDGGNIATQLNRPWKIEVYIAFAKQEKAIAFERYLKFQSGRAFAKKRFW